MTAVKRMVNRAAIRGAFHRRGTRVPRGFIEEIEQAVYVLLRRAAAGEIEPKVVISGVDVDRIERAYKKREEEAEVYLKQSLLKEALREALGKHRVETAWVAHMNATVGTKVSEASIKASACMMGTSSQGVPGRVMRAFLRSPESKSMTVSEFCRRWQETGFRDLWIERTNKGWSSNGRP